MKQQIQFIKGKWLWTKSIEDLTITAFFEISKEMYEKAHKNINKILKLEVEYLEEKIELSCNICTDTKWYLSYHDDHWVLRLDITIENILLAWFILAGTIYLTLE